MSHEDLPQLLRTVAAVIAAEALRMAPPAPQAPQGTDPFYRRDPAG